MKAIENGEVVDSVVLHLLDEDALPAAGPVTVSIHRFVSEREQLRARGDVGIRLASTDSVDDVAPLLSDVTRVALDFPKFADGRSYSNARLLRDKFGFDGELRAIGDVLRDQLFYMYRCGFDAFEVREDKDAQDALKALREFSVTYQPAAGNR